MNQVQEQVLEIAKVVDAICCANRLPYSLGFGSVLGAVRHSGFIPWDNDIDLLVKLPDIERFRSVLQRELPSNLKYINWETESRYSLWEDRVAFLGKPHEAIHLDVNVIVGASENIEEQQRFQRNAYTLFRVLHCKHRKMEDFAPRNRAKARLVKPFLGFVPDAIINAVYHGIDTRYDYNSSKWVFVPACPSEGGVVEKDVFNTVVRVPFEDTELPIPVRYNEYLTSLYGDYMIERQEDFYV